MKLGRLSTRALATVITASLILAVVPSDALAEVIAATRLPAKRAALSRALTQSATTERVAGQTLYDTAVEVSKKAFQRADTVVLATGRAFPDALAGAPLAYAEGAPLLLTDTHRLPGAVAGEITRLGATHVIILGGVYAVGPEVVSALGRLGLSGSAVTRIWGQTCYDTSSDIALALKAKIGDTPRVMLTTGANFPDALAAAGLAARGGIPILLTKPTTLPDATRVALASLAASSTIVLGGTGAVSESVAKSFPSPLRLGGTTLYDTAKDIAEYAYSTGFTYSTVMVATGEKFPDALAAGPWAAALGAPLVLTQRTKLPAATDDFFRSHCSSIEKIVILGGSSGAVSESVAVKIAAAATTVIAAGTAVEDTETAQSVSALASDTIVFSRSTDQLAGVVSGDVLVGREGPEAPSGFLRRVLSVSPLPDGRVSLTTTDACLSDVIAKGSLDLAVPLDAPAAPGGAARFASGAPHSADHRFSTSLEFDETFDNTVEAKGKLEFSATYTFNASFDLGGLRSAEVKVRDEAEIETELALLALNKDREWTRNIGPRIALARTVIWAGPVPVYISGGAQPLFGASGKFQVGVKTRTKASVWFEVGSRYDGSWHPIGGAGASATYTTPTVSVAGEVKAFVGLKVDCTIDGVIGPYCEGDVFAKYEWDTSDDPLWKLNIGVDARVGGKVEILGKKLVKFEETWMILEMEIARAPGRHIVTIPDPALQSAVRSALGIPSGDITDVQMKSLTSLDAGSRGVKSLDGLQYATSLHDLAAGDNQITDISPLAGLTSLKSLNLVANRLADIGPVAGLTNLTSLSVGSNQIVDVSAVSGLSGLTDLDLGHNQVRDVTPLAGLTNLTILYLWSNRIADIAPLTTLKGLTELGLDDNEITDVGPLRGLPSLNGLLLRRNKITDINPLAGLTRLDSLFLSGNQITDITLLGGLTNLTDLLLDNNEIVDVSSLETLPSLFIADVSNNFLDLAPGSATSDVVAGLKNRIQWFTYLPQREVHALDGYCNVVAFEPASSSGLAGAVTMSIEKSIDDGDAVVWRQDFVATEPGTVFMVEQPWQWSGTGPGYRDPPKTISRAEFLDLLRAGNTLLSTTTWSWGSFNGGPVRLLNVVTLDPYSG